MTALHDLDAHALPQLAARLRRAARRGAELRDRLRGHVEGLQPQHLDDRFSGSRGVRLAEQRPVVVSLVAVAVLAAGVAVAVDQESGAPAAGPGASSTELVGQGGSALPGALLGPSIGDSTKDYERESSRGLVAAAAADPADTRVALVSLADYRTPAEAAAVLSGFTVQRAYLRARKAGQRASALPVEVSGPLLPALRKAYADTARSRRVAELEYRRYVSALKPSGTQGRAFRQLYADYAASSGVEAHEYATGCACVYAALVSAPAAQLLSLRARPGIRVVQVAGKGLNALQVQVQPLLPDVSGVVPRPTLPVPHQ